MTRSLTVCILIIQAIIYVQSNNILRDLKSWKTIDYKFSTPAEKQAAIDSGRYVPQNNLPLGLEVWKNKLFITVPRWKSGVPSSLNYVNLNSENSPLLMPYPNFDMNTISANRNETKIVSTFRIQADKCDRLWVMDSGMSDVLGKLDVVSPPKLLVFDLNTDKLINTYTLKSSDYKDGSFFANVIVDVEITDCDNAYAYLPDLGAYGLVVYSLKQHDSWRIEHHFFHFDPLSGNYNVGGVNFQWTDGIFGISLSRANKDGSRTLFFHPLSSTREFAVSNKIIQTKQSTPESYHQYKVLGSRGPCSQATASVLHEETGVMLYNMINKNAVGCWNSVKHANEYSADTNGIVDSNNVTMIFPNDLKIDKQGNVYVLTDRLPTYIYRELNYDDVNFRILSAPIKTLIKGTVCEA